MAGCLRKNSLLFSLLVILLSIVPSYARFEMLLTQSNINSICPKSRNPGFCQNFLKSNPKISTADLPTAARIALDSVGSSAQQTFNQIRSLILKTQRKELKQAYVSCANDHDSAYGFLDDAQRALGAGDYKGSDGRVSDAVKYVGMCQDVLKSVQGDPTVIKRSDDLENICSVVSVISSMLPH